MEGRGASRSGAEGVAPKKEPSVLSICTSYEPPCLPPLQSGGPMPGTPSAGPFPGIGRHSEASWYDAPRASAKVMIPVRCRERDQQGK